LFVGENGGSRGAASGAASVLLIGARFFYVDGDVVLLVAAEVGVEREVGRADVGRRDEGGLAETRLPVIERSA